MSNTAITDSDRIRDLQVSLDYLTRHLNDIQAKLEKLESEIKKLKGDDALNAILEELRKQKVPQPYPIPQTIPQTPEFPFYPTVTCAPPPANTVPCDTTCNKKNPPECSCKDYTGGPA